MTLRPPCPECQVGSLDQRPTGFWACDNCGRLVIRVDVPPDAQDVDIHMTINRTPEGAYTPAQPLPVAPDYTDCMVGWRAWRWNGARLASVTMSQHEWNPRQTFSAVCKHSHRAEGGVPGNRCGCGIYAAKARPHLRSMGYHRYQHGQWRVIGEVSLWGKIVEGTQGWRAAHAYPRRILVPFEAFEIVEPIRDAYGVPVELDNTLKDVLRD